MDTTPEPPAHDPDEEPLRINGRPATNLPPKLDAFFRHQRAKELPDGARMQRDPVYALRIELESQVTLIDSAPLFGAAAKLEHYHRRAGDACALAMEFIILLRGTHDALPPTPASPATRDTRIWLLGLIEWCYAVDRSGVATHWEPRGQELDLLLRRIRMATLFEDPSEEELIAAFNPDAAPGEARHEAAPALDPAEAMIRRRLTSRAAQEKVLRTLESLRSTKSEFLASRAPELGELPAQTLHDAAIGWAQADVRGRGTSRLAYRRERVIQFVIESWSPK